MKRTPMVRKPTKEKKPTLNHPDRPYLPHREAVKGFEPKRRASIAKTSPRRSQELLAYAKHKLTLPDLCIDPLTGETFHKSQGEPHHPGLHWKKCFNFVVYVTPSTHRQIHERPEQAVLDGLLFRGRTRKACTPDDAREMLKLVPHPETFMICIELWEKTLNLPTL